MTISLAQSCKMKKVHPTFIVNKAGVYYGTKDNLLWICSPLYVKALVRDHCSNNWGRLLEFLDADGTRHCWSMPMEFLKGNCEELRGELLRQGVNIASGISIRNLLIQYILTASPSSRARCVTRTGWHDHLFVLPDRTFGETSEHVIYQSHLPLKDYQSAGTLHDWQQYIGKYCMGNSRLVLAISTAFAAMLLSLANAESGGLHFVGESSTGKTTALKVAASVWGGATYLHRWRATTNGIEALAALRSDTLLVLDELSQVDPKEAGEIAYLLANGSGKTRASKTGAAQARADWRLLFLSAGEISLATHLKDIGKKIKAGQEVRLIDVPSDAGKGLGLFETLHHFDSGCALSHVLHEASTRYYGTPAAAFLEYITVPAHLKLLPGMIKNTMTEFMKENLPSGASGQAQRVCERFALIAAAGELASIYGMTGWPVEEASTAAATCFQVWLEQRGGIGNHERTTLLRQVQAFFEAHSTSRFEAMNETNPHDSRIINRMGFRRTTLEGENEYFVLPEMFRQELCAGFDFKMAIRVLIDAGMLQVSSEGKVPTPHRLPGEGVRKCYHFIHTVPQSK